ncbi:hypothetical protein JYG46_23485, partial [Escherichia fergusonii]|uniref:DNA-packaging protein FI n=1 Tax=Escherichia fergusonii TaxID=564 RepID=UPI001CBCCB61
MTKDELIARLRSLGEQLNRDVSLTGTKEELALRVAELKEELDDTDETAENKPDLPDGKTEQAVREIAGQERERAV